MRRAVLAAALMLTAAACGGDASPTAAGHEHDGAHGAESFAFGKPGDPTAADRTIRVETLDSLEFDPSSLDVQVGETVTFEVANPGSLEHEFVLGPRDVQQEMGGGHGHGANGVHLPPAVVERFTWTFTKAGTVLYGCHVDDHYSDGMVGEITVTE